MGLPYLPAKSCKSVGSDAMALCIRVIATPRGVVVSVVAVGLPELTALAVDVKDPPRTPWSRSKPTRVLLLPLLDGGDVPSVDVSKLIIKKVLTWFWAGGAMSFNLQ